MKNKLLIVLSVLIVCISFTVVSFAEIEAWNTDKTMYYNQDGNPVTGIYEVPNEGLYSFGDDCIVKLDVYETYTDGLLYYFGKDSEGKPVPGIVFSGTYSNGYYEAGILKVATGTYNGAYYVNGVKKVTTGTYNGAYYVNGVKKVATGTYNGAYYVNGVKKVATGTYNGAYYVNGVKKVATGTYNGAYYVKGVKQAKKGYTGFSKSYYYKSGVKFVPGKAGIYKLGKQYYYVKAKGLVSLPGKAGVHKMSNGHYYYTYKSGALKRVSKSGVYKIGKSSYLFTGSFTVACSGKTAFEKLGKNTYLVDKTGKLLSGWYTTAKGAKYYFSPSSYAAAKNGMKKIGGKLYCFTASGKVCKNKWVKKNGKKYYFKKTGAAATGGPVKIGKYKYFFSKAGVLQTNLIKYKGYSWVASHPLKVLVNRKTNTVTIYARDKGKYSIPVATFLCTVGSSSRPTDKGTYRTGAVYRWKELGGKTEEQDNGDPCWGQYVTHIYGAVYFHSITFEKKNNHTLFTGAYNNLGHPGSHGCVRLKCGDAYQMYNLAKRRTMTVKIFDGSSPGPFGKPALKKIGTRYDPTDPNV